VLWRRSWMGTAQPLHTPLQRPVLPGKSEQAGKDICMSHGMQRLRRPKINT
jgi:hypothetical protein